MHTRREHLARQLLEDVVTSTVAHAEVASLLVVERVQRADLLDEHEELHLQGLGVAQKERS